MDIIGITYDYLPMMRESCRKLLYVTCATSSHPSDFLINPGTRVYLKIDVSYPDNQKVLMLTDSYYNVVEVLGSRVVLESPILIKSKESWGYKISGSLLIKN